jgi:glycosyltransferase involved in cell wall biosynthesis
MTEPLVSITIPTYNSARTLGACLESIKQQTYPRVETIVIDSHSSDTTQEIARKHGAQIITTDAWLLGARVVGIQAAQGEFIVLLDSDHIMSPSAIARAVEMMDTHDGLYLEERSLETRTLVQRLFDADRQLVQSQVALHSDPLKGVLLGRIFKRDLLLEAISHIPPEVVQKAVTFDHEIINYEFTKRTQRLALLPEAIWHHEPETVTELWRKNTRYGRAARTMTRLGYYRELRREKARPRLGAWKPRLLWWGLQSTLLLMLKAPALLIGYFSPPRKVTSK